MSVCGLNTIFVRATLNGDCIFTASFPFADPLEPNAEFTRLLAKAGLPSDSFGAVTANELHKTIEAMYPGCVWSARHVKE